MRLALDSMDLVEQIASPSPVWTGTDKAGHIEALDSEESSVPVEGISPPVSGIGLSACRGIGLSTPV